MGLDDDIMHPINAATSMRVHCPRGMGLLDFYGCLSSCSPAFFLICGVDGQDDRTMALGPFALCFRGGGDT